MRYPLRGVRREASRSIALSATLLLCILLHFHSPANFTRPLLDYDDTEFIAPLDGMGLSAYFGDWAAKPDHYVFPLRDLTFALDFKLSRLLHVQTFWLVDFAIFLLTLVAIWRIFELYYRGRPLLVAVCVGLQRVRLVGSLPLRPAAVPRTRRAVLAGRTARRRA